MKKINNIEIILLSIFYLIISIIFQIFNNDIYIKIINPLFWLIIGIIYYIKSKKIYFRFNNYKLYKNKLIIWMIAYILIIFDIGFITGYGKNPFNMSILGILNNIIQIIIPIVGIEIFRSYFINKNKNNKLINIIFILLIFIIEANIPYYISNINDRELLFKYFCSTTAPLIFVSFLSSYFALLGSYKLSLIYRLVSELIFILLPIIPNINWFVKGTSSMIFISILYVVYRYKYVKLDEDEERKNTNNGSIGYSLSIVACILLVLFMLGVFKYEPIAIVSNSMVPVYYRGDVLIYEKFSQEELKKLKEGNIIVYKIGDKYVAHRIKNVVMEDGKIKFLTKGDNNQSDDGVLVNISDIKGVYVGSIKYIGYPTVWLNEFFAKQ